MTAGHPDGGDKADRPLRDEQYGLEFVALRHDGQQRARRIGLAAHARLDRRYKARRGGGNQVGALALGQRQTAVDFGGGHAQDGDAVGGTRRQLRQRETQFHDLAFLRGQLLAQRIEALDLTKPRILPPSLLHAGDITFGSEVA
jgi:hypothetical protein